jgi:hypothetical protein
VGAADKVAAFSNLPEGDQLEISFRSSGCFKRDAYNLTFHRATETTAFISDLEGRQLTLSKADVDGLDRLMRSYRSIVVTPVICTTSDSITISQRHEGEIVATEEYSDGSCATGAMKDITRIPDLVRRLRKLE